MMALERYTQRYGKGSTWENVKRRWHWGGVWQGPAGGDSTTRPWMTRDAWSTRCSRSFSGRGKKEKKCRSYTCSQFYFSEYR